MRSLPALDGGPAAARSREAAPVWSLPGFGRKTRIRTAFGELPVEALRLRDEVRTGSGRIVRVVWIDAVRLDTDYLQRNPEAQPVLIRENGFDHGKPMRDMLVSPRQELSYGLGDFEYRFAMASALTGRPNVLRKPEFCMTYFMFHCGEPAVIYAEGVPVLVSPPPAAVAGAED